MPRDSDPGERAAVERLRRGDIGGLEELVRRHQLRAVRAACLVTRDRDLAEDIVSDAFLRCYERISQFDPRRQFEPWFMRIVVNDALKAMTRRGGRLAPARIGAPHARGLANLVATAESAPDAVAEESETRRALADAISELGPEARAAIVLHYYLGLSGPEIAMRTASPLGTVKRRLHDARRRLRELLADHREARSSARTTRRAIASEGDVT